MADTTVVGHWTITDPDGNRLVHVVTDRSTNQMTISITGRPLLTLDVLRARALGMALAESTYVGLEPSGPWLAVIRE